MQHIETITAGSAVASIDFTSIPQDYTDLFLVISGRSTRTSNVNDDLLIELNNTSANFSFVLLRGNGSGVASPSSSVNFAGYLPASDATSDTFGNTGIYISNYTSSQNKSLSIDTVTENNATSAFAGINAVLWSVGSAITSVLLEPANANFDTNTTASLYGITAGGSGTVGTA